jgi:hypothetical protein
MSGAGHYCCHALQDMVADGAASQPGSNVPLPAYAYRTVLTAADDACGVEPLLKLQQGFGAAYLGELLQAYISASNVSTASVQSVQLRVSQLSGSSTIAYYC